MSNAENPIAALWIRRQAWDGAYNVRGILVGSKRRHFSKRLLGSYDWADLDTGSLQAVYPGHTVFFRGNGQDDNPRDPSIPSWTLDGLDFRIWGDSLIVGIRHGLYVGHTIDTQDFLGRLQRENDTGARYSALLQRSTARP